MKSFRLTRTELNLLRENLQTSPHPVENGRQQGYSGDDLEMVDTLCHVLDKAIGPYRVEGRNRKLATAREERAIRLLNDPNERAIQLARLEDAQTIFLEELDERLGQDVLVVSLEDAEADWLSENFLKRTNWFGFDGVRERIIAVRRAVKKDAMISWRSKEGTEPSAEDFDKKDDKVVTLKPKGETESSESAEKVG